MKRLAIIAAASVIVLATAVPSLAARDKGKNSAKKAIQKVAAAYTAAFNKGDAKAMAAFWTPQGDYIGPRGELIKGRDAIEKRFAEFFAVNTETRLEITITSIRFVGDDVAIVDDIPEVTPPLQGPPVKARGTIVLVKQGDQWLVESVRDTFSYPPSHYDHLKNLEWLIGDWADVASSDEVSVQSTCDWTVNKNFIIRRFSADLKGRGPFAGTQLIAWDPRENRIRSWVFDSDGGFAEGLWQRDGKRWIIAASGVLADGGEVSATNIVTLVDNDTFTFQSTNRTVNGQQQPDIGPIEVKRQSSLADRQSGLAAPKQPARETILPK